MSPSDIVSLIFAIIMCIGAGIGLFFCCYRCYICCPQFIRDIQQQQDPLQRRRETTPLYYPQPSYDTEYNELDNEV